MLCKTILSRGELLGLICNQYKNVIAVCGCHGKTTTTAMFSHIFLSAGKSFTCHIGGRDLSLNNYYCSGRDFFITEACEYKKNFLKVKADVGVILNTEADHMDCYANLDELKGTYRQFAKNCNKPICLYGDIDIGNGITFGFDDRADYFPTCIKDNGGKFSFIVNEGDRVLGKVNLNVFGKHNILNAIAAVAAARSYGLSFDAIYKGLADFKGVERRFEEIGKINGCSCIADYAHHPQEIEATIRTAKLVARKNLYVVFQPHTYSRTKSLFKDFVNILSKVDNLLIYKTFAAREYFDNDGCALTLSQAVANSVYGDCPEDIKNFLGKAERDDLVLILGAGDIYYIAKSLLD
jgi:UDP-N-acetylmuramate--alanine ligase